VTRDLDLLTQGLIVQHLYVKFGDLSCIGFKDIVRENRQTNGGRTKLGHKEDKVLGGDLVLPG